MKFFRNLFVAVSLGLMALGWATAPSAAQVCLSAEAAETMLEGRTGLDYRFLSTEGQEIFEEAVRGELGDPGSHVSGVIAPMIPSDSDFEGTSAPFAITFQRGERTCAVPVGVTVTVETMNGFYAALVAAGLID